MKLLSLKELEMFDYVKTRERVEEYIGDLNMIKFKYRKHILEDKISNLQNIKPIIFSFSVTNNMST